MTAQAAELETPVATSWLVGRAAAAAAGDETSISEDTARHLGFRSRLEASLLGATIVTSDTPESEQHWILTRGATPVSASRVGDRLFRYVVVVEPAGGAAQPPRPTRGGLHALLDAVQERLGVPKTTVSDVLGVSRSTFYRHEDDDAPVDGSLTEVVRRAEFLGGLSIESPDAASALLRQSRDATKQLLADNDYLSTRRLFVDTWRQIAAARPRQRGATIERLSTLADRAAGLLDDPAFEQALELVTGVSPYAGEFDVERARAFADLDQAYDAVVASEPVDEDWAFLLTMRSADRATFRDEAFDLIRSAGFSRDAWLAFLDRASALAVEAYAPVILEPLPTPALRVAQRSEDLRDIEDEDDAEEATFYDRRVR